MERYAHIQVTDPDRGPIASTMTGRRPGEGGWGLGIVDGLSAARWTTYGDDAKTVHVIVPAPGIEPTSAELGAMTARGR